MPRQVTFKGQDYTIRISDVTLMDGNPLDVQYLPGDDAPIYGGHGGKGRISYSDN